MLNDFGFRKEKAIFNRRNKACFSLFCILLYVKILNNESQGHEFMFMFTYQNISLHFIVCCIGGVLEDF